VALPLAIAFAIASGVSPERGLFTAIIAGLLISALGGSRVQIGGPTGAFVVIVYAIVQRHGVEGLAMATLMAGVILVGFGLARLGGAIKFIPYPVTIGFTSGIALIIFSGEVKDFLGLKMGAVPAPFLAKWKAYALSFPSLSLEPRIITRSSPTRTSTLPGRTPGNATFAMISSGVARRSIGGERGASSRRTMASRNVSMKGAGSGRPKHLDTPGPWPDL